MIGATILSMALLGAAGGEVVAKDERDTLLYVVTSPPGAEVLVDGKRVGTAPGLFPFEPGVRRVIVELEGHDKHGQDVTIRAGDITRLKLRLTRRAEANGDSQLGQEVTLESIPAGWNKSPKGREVLERLKLQSPRQDEAKVDSQPGPEATLESILARLNNPPKGWKVLESQSKSGAELADAAGEFGGRVEHASLIGLSRCGKRILASVCECAPGEDLERIRDKMLQSTVRRTILIRGLSSHVNTPGPLRNPGSRVRTSSKASPVACLTYGRTIVTFLAADQFDREFLEEAIRELGFKQKPQLPLWADLPKQHELRKQDRVQLVVGKEKMTLEGEPTSWDELRPMLRKLPDLENTVLYISGTTDDWVINEWEDAIGRIYGICDTVGIKSTSFIGVHPLGSRQMLSIRLVIAGRDNMTLEGRQVKESELDEVLLSFPERYRTTLQVVRATEAGDSMTIKQWRSLSWRAATTALLLGFKSVTDIGERPLGSTASSDEPDAPGSDHQPAPSQLDEALELIERNYVVGLDRPELVEAAIRGMVEELDRHSDYVNQAELTALREQVAQQLSGIGLELEFDQGAREVRVVSPLPQMPAYRAGVRAGDTIVQIDGKPTREFPQGKELETAATLLRGKPGSEVTVGLKHSGSDELRQITIVREVIHLPALRGDVRKADGTWDFMLDDDRKIGYVRLTHFNAECADDLKNALDELKSRDMKALVLDLRGNPGGSLSEAIQVADLFIGDGVIVSIESRQMPGKTWFAKSEGTLGKLPMAVLVDRASAGAAEIVAACLQDHRRAIVVGERTYGKGTAHKILELRCGDGALRLPTAIFIRPNGKGFHRFDGAEQWDPWGVVPDEKCQINLTKDEYRRFLEYRRQRDVLDPEGPPMSDFQDRQLQMAMERL